MIHLPTLALSSLARVEPDQLDAKPGYRGNSTTSKHYAPPASSIGNTKMTDSLADQRRSYAQLLVEKTGRPNDQSLKSAFESVPRELFLGEGPWKVPDMRGGYDDAPSTDAGIAYQDILFALDADKGINNGQPSLHAMNLSALDISPSESILHIGAGTGYYTAIMAEITGDNGSVLAFEYEPALAAQASQNLQQWPQTTVVQGSVFDAQLPMADVIYANAGMPYIETTWVQQLKDGGRLLFPLTCSNGSGVMLLVLRHGADYFASVISRCGFISCVGTNNSQASDNLAALFRSGRANQITRLYLSEPANAESVLLGGDGWYLCNA